MHASQISIGEENNLAIWVHGEKGSLEWHQEHPNYLTYKGDERAGAGMETGQWLHRRIQRSGGRGTRLPFGHPEAFFEAFANNYRNFAETVKCAIAGEKPGELAQDFPGVNEGVRGILFIETVVASAKSAKKWTPMKK